MGMTLADVRDARAYALAGLAECAGPDAPDSPGAQLLLSVARDLAERIDYARQDGESLSVVLDRLSDDGTFTEIADGAPDVYTFTRWREFVDLAAWQEEPEVGSWPDDLTEAAGWALYQIAERLVNALAQELRDGEDDEDDEDDEAGEA